jgi:preprotein translocase subunit SecD
MDASILAQLSAVHFSGRPERHKLEPLRHRREERMSRFRRSQVSLSFLLAAAIAGCMPAPAPSLQMTLQLRPAQDVPAETALAETRTTLRKRLDDLGFANAVIEAQGGDRLSIRVPNARNPELLRRVLLSETVLELRFVRFPTEGGNLSSQEAVLAHYEGNLPPELEILRQEVTDGQGKVTEEAFFAVEKKPVITGRDIASARPSLGSMNQPIVEFHLKPEAAEIFSEATGDNLGSRLAIVLDGKVMSAPVIHARIGDTGLIEGDFTADQALELAITLSSGPLPTGLILVEEKAGEPGGR